MEKIAVLGAGAIGSIIGAYLTRAGRDVTLIDAWGEHVDTMRRDGLRITALDEEFVVPVEAVHLGQLSAVLDPFDAAFLCVKSYDTVWSTHLILPHLKPAAPIVSAQNGVNDETIAQIAGYTREIGCVVILGAGLYAAGHALRTTAPDMVAFAVSELSGLRSPRVEALAEMMNAIGPTRITGNLWGDRWSKLATNCMFNSVCAVTGLGSGDVRTTPGAVDASIRIAAEVARVGRALGVVVEPINGIPAETYERCGEAGAMERIKTGLAAGAGGFGAGRPSMLQDVMKRRRTEIDHLNGYVAARGAEVGVDTPANEGVIRLVKLIERGRLESGIDNIERLPA